MGLALLGVLVPSGCVGFLAALPGERFDWATASAFGTALGTTLLAAVTGLLVYATSRDVSATLQIAELTRAEHDRENLPKLILYSVLVGDSNEFGHALHVQFVNAGRAPALRVEVRVAYEREPHSHFVADATIPVIMPAELRPLELPLQGAVVGLPEGTSADSYEVTARYRDPAESHEISL